MWQASTAQGVKRSPQAPSGDGGTGAQNLSPPGTAPTRRALPSPAQQPKEHSRMQGRGNQADHAHPAATPSLPCLALGEGHHRGPCTESKATCGATSLQGGRRPAHQGTPLALGVVGWGHSAGPQGPLLVTLGGVGGGVLRPGPEQMAVPPRHLAPGLPHQGLRWGGLLPPHMLPLASLHSRDKVGEGSDCSYHISQSFSFFMEVVLGQ